jgi:hypothetical protein
MAWKSMETASFQGARDFQYLGLLNPSTSYELRPDYTKNVSGDQI